MYDSKIKSINQSIKIKRYIQMQSVHRNATSTSFVQKENEYLV